MRPGERGIEHVGILGEADAQHSFAERRAGAEAGDRRGARQPADRTEASRQRLEPLPDRLQRELSSSPAARPHRPVLSSTVLGSVRAFDRSSTNSKNVNAR
jgi:hypothetical protein